MEAAHFVPSFRHSQFISRVKDDIGHDSARAAMRQTFIKHYYDKFGEPELPPSWMVFETLTFGTVSQAFKNLTRQNQKPIAKALGLDGTVLGSWLHALPYVMSVIWLRTTSGCGITPTPSNRLPPGTRPLTCRTRHAFMPKP